MTIAAPATGILPTRGDGAAFATAAERHITLSRLGQVAQAADKLGYFGVLPPLRAATGIDLDPARNATPFGEVIANPAAPVRRAVVQAAHP